MRQGYNFFADLTLLIFLILKKNNLKLLAHMKINVNLILHFYNYQKSQVYYEIVCMYHNQLSVFKRSLCSLMK